MTALFASFTTCIPSLTFGYFGYNRCENRLSLLLIIVIVYRGASLKRRTILGVTHSRPGTLKHLPWCKEAYPCKGKTRRKSCSTECCSYSADVYKGI